MRPDGTAPNPGPDARIDALIERCRELHDAPDLPSVIAWKEAEPARRAFGYLPIYIPSEIVHAVGGLPVGIIGGGDRTDVIRGDAYFQSYICRLPRSTVELGLQGRLDCLDGMLFPAICDVVRNLSGIWQLLFPGRLTVFMDFPQNFDPAIGGRFYRDQLTELAGTLSGITGIPLTDAGLAASIAVYDTNRALIRELHTLRSDAPGKVPTYEAYLLQRAGHVLPVEKHNAMLREYIDLAWEREEATRDSARVVLLGAFCEQPPLALIKSLDLAGCYVVDDDFLLGNRMITRDVGAGSDPLDRLVTAYLETAAPCSSIYDPGGARAAALVDRVGRHHADGVVFAAPSFCDPALLDRPLYQKALDTAGIPYTAFKYAENTGQLSAIREQVGTFAESILLWGSAPAVAGRSAR